MLSAGVLAPMEMGRETEGDRKLGTQHEGSPLN